ncbi:hypothetical protein D9M68_842570 [compost metagenome]
MPCWNLKLDAVFRLLLNEVAGRRRRSLADAKARQRFPWAEKSTLGGAAESVLQRLTSYTQGGRSRYLVVKVRPV